MLSDFDKRLKRSERTFSVMFWLIVAMQILIVGLIVATVIAGIQEIRATDWSHGLRGVVNQIWCGPKGCQ